MQSRARFSCLLALIVLALVQFSACSGTPATFNRVSISPSGTMYIAQGGAISLISATVLNDTQLNGGVIFTLLPAGVGTLTQLTSSTASYVAPGVVTSETIVTITATSVDFPAQSATLTVKIEPPPTITTTSLPTATLGAAYSAPITATGGVPPLAWTLASGTLPAGLKLGASNTDTVNITGTATTAGSVGDHGDGDGCYGSVQHVWAAADCGEHAGVHDHFAAATSDGGHRVQRSNSLRRAGHRLTRLRWRLDRACRPGLRSPTDAGNANPTTLGTFTFGITVTDSAPTPAAITNTFTLVMNPVQDLTLLAGHLRVHLQRI